MLQVLTKNWKIRPIHRGRKHNKRVTLSESRTKWPNSPKKHIHTKIVEILCQIAPTTLKLLKATKQW